MTSKKELIRNAWSILCGSSSIDRDNNTLSIFDIVEDLTIVVTEELKELTGFPMVMHLVTQWIREEGDGPLSLNAKFILKDPAGVQLQEATGTIQMEAHHQRARFRAQMHGFPVTQAGRYIYEIISLEPEKTGGIEVVNKVYVDLKIEVQKEINPEQIAKKLKGE